MSDFTIEVSWGGNTVVVVVDTDKVKWEHDAMSSATCVRTENRTRNKKKKRKKRPINLEIHDKSSKLLGNGYEENTGAPLSG